MTLKNSKIKKSKTAQAAIELAVFGVILIFVLGTLIRQAVGDGYAQNQSLKAMRLAMTMSFYCSHGMNGCSPFQTSRNNANVLFIEDRLTSDPGKYGAIDRVPYVFTGGGSHSKQFFQPVEDGEIYNLPVYDVFINGQHFPLKTSGFKTVDLSQAAVTSNGIPFIGWEDPCTIYESYGTNTTGYGCAYFHSRIPNYPDSKEWCDTTDSLDPHYCDPNENLPLDERFDLNLDGTFPDVNDVDGIFPDYDDFSWQWIKVLSVDLPKVDDIDHSLGANTTLYIANPWADAGVDFNRQYHLSVDIDGDFKEERIVKILGTNGSTAVFNGVRVMDSQEGDIDFSFDDRDTGPPPGLQSDVQMWVLTRDGTYYQLDQGRLFSGIGDNREFHRTISKKDQIDVVQRLLLLSNDTDTFCDAAGVPNHPSIEVCNPRGTPPANNVCFQLANINRTCMDENTLIIYVRSRISDLHGRKYVTDVSSDLDVGFVQDPAN